MTTPITDLKVSNFGDEKVVNGDFSSNVGWTFGQDGGNGWSYDGTNDEADCDGDQSAGVDLERDISSVAAELYLLSYKIKNWVAGTITPQIGGVDGVARGADGTWESYITATGTGNLKLQADSDFQGSIDDVSVKKILYSASGNLYMTWTNGEGYDSIRVIRDGQPYEIIDGDATSYTDTEVVANTLYEYKMQGRITGDFVEPSASDSGGYWRDIVTTSVVVTGSSVESVVGTDYADTVTGTVYVTGVALDAISLKTNYAYYLGDSSGKIYEYSDSFKGDAGSNIVARWESKDTDFSDQKLEISNHFKTVEYIRLYYIDKTSSAAVNVSVSTDGGATWINNSKTIGTGDEKAKIQDYYIMKTGRIFRFLIQSASASDSFQFTGLEVFFSVGGD